MNYCGSISCWGVMIILLAGFGAGCQQEEKIQIDPQLAFLDASRTLRHASIDPDPLIRAHAVEALAKTLGAEAGAIYKQGLRDKYPIVRLASAMAIGDIQYTPAKEMLSAMAQPRGDDARSEPDKRVFVAVVYALHRMGDTSHTNELGQLLFDDEKEIRACVAQVMGRMGEQAAKDPLTGRLDLEYEPMVRIQLVQSLALLGDSRSMTVLEAYTKLQWVEDRLVAIEAMELVPSERSRRVLEIMMAPRHPPQVRVKAAGGLGALGHADEYAYELCLNALTDPDSVLREFPGSGGTVSPAQASSLRCLATISLGKINRYEAIEVLHPLLEDPDGPVRIAAAMSLLSILKPYAPGAAAPLAPLEPEPVARPLVQPIEPARPLIQPIEQVAPAEVIEPIEPSAPAEVIQVEPGDEVVEQSPQSQPTTQPDEEVPPVPLAPPLPELHTSGGKD